MYLQKAIVYVVLYIFFDRRRRGKQLLIPAFFLSKRKKKNNQTEIVVTLVDPWITKEGASVEPVHVVECLFAARTTVGALVVCWTTSGWKVGALNVINCSVTPQTRQELANVLFSTCIFSCCLCYQVMSLSYKPMATTTIKNKKTKNSQWIVSCSFPSKHSNLFGCCSCNVSGLASGAAVACLFCQAQRHRQWSARVSEWQGKDEQPWEEQQTRMEATEVGVITEGNYCS